MDEVEAVARALCEASPVFKSRWDEQTPVEKHIWRGIARAAIAALDKARGPSFMDVTLFDTGAMHGREEGLREAAAVAAALPVPQDNARISYWTGYADGTEEARDAILALIDAKERISANE